MIIWKYKIWFKINGIIKIFKQKKNKLKGIETVEKRPYDALHKYVGDLFSTTGDDEAKIEKPKSKKWSF